MEVSMTKVEEIKNEQDISENPVNVRKVQPSISGSKSIDDVL